MSRALTDTPGLELVVVTPTAHDPIVQYLGVVARSPRRDEARSFAAFLTGKVGQAMLVDLGFSPVAPASPPAPVATPATAPAPAPAAP